MLHILKCTTCGKYGLDETCPCGGKCYKPKPPKYSPEDKYGEYRRKAKEGKLGQKEEDDEDDSVDDNDSQETEDQ